LKRTLGQEQEVNDEMRVEFANGDRRLVGNFFFPLTSATPGPGLLFVHGLGSDQTGYAPRAERAAAALGAVCLTFDLSGHGQSDGVRNSLAPCDHAEDVVAAFNVLIGPNEADAARIGICGASYGAYLSALMLPQHRVRKLLLRAPALYDDEMFNTTLAQPRKARADVVAPRLSRALREFSGEVLVLESGADETIPHSVIEWYLDACPSARHKVIEDASHALTTKKWREAFLAEIVSFFHGL
jgi:pimeloyl-ACP methyl ester carboxylesterase